MARIKLEIPDTLPFETTIPIRITDLNYGGHVGNDTILSLIHQARMEYLQSKGLSELKFGSASLIMADAAIEFKAELFFGDTLVASVGAGEFSKSGFELYYRLEKISGEQRKTVALAKTSMVCFDYEIRKVVRIPDGITSLLMN